MKLTLLFLFFLVSPLLHVDEVHAGEVKVAVAANFLNTLHTLAPLFEQQSGHMIDASHIKIHPGLRRAPRAAIKP